MNRHKKRDTDRDVHTKKELDVHRKSWTYKERETLGRASFFRGFICKKRKRERWKEKKKRIDQT